MNRWNRVAVVTTIVVSTVGLVACGDDTKEDKPVSTEVMTEKTEVMADKTEVMTDKTEVMTDSTEVMTESTGG